jgi:hypothetical protein
MLINRASGAGHFAEKLIGVHFVAPLPRSSAALNMNCTARTMRSMAAKFIKTAIDFEAYRTCDIDRPGK